ncbi:hypothetical protein PSSHI_19980 [Photobacterium sp. R1]
MKINQPVWYLSTQHGYCPLCEGQSGLVFISCTQCRTVYLQCDEYHTFYAMRLFTVCKSEFTCPNCGEKIEDANPATSQQILASGFTKNDYC